MFDAKSILESLVRGAAQQAPAHGQGGGGLADILGQVLGGGQEQGTSRAPSQGGGGGGLGDLLGELERSMQNKGGATQGGQAGGGGLSDILGQLQKQLGQGAGGPARGAVETPSAPSGGGLEDILGQLKDQLGKAGGAIQGGPGGQGGGGLMDVLGQVLAQATQGVKEGAGKIDNATGASDTLGKATGQNPADLLKQLQDLVRDNPLAAGGAMGGLGGLVLGTKTGRSIAGSAARIGALALMAA